MDDKIIQLFRNGDYDLAQHLAEGQGIDLDAVLEKHLTDTFVSYKSHNRTVRQDFPAINLREALCPNGRAALLQNSVKAKTLHEHLDTIQEKKPKLYEKLAWIRVDLRKKIYR